MGIPDDRQLVIGAHTLRVNAYPSLNEHGEEWITYKFAVYEWYDFRKYENNMFTIPYTGISVPTYWADQLVDNNMAAEYWTIIRWTDIDWVDQNYLRGAYILDFGQMSDLEL